jgi:putative transposase
MEVLPQLDPHLIVDNSCTHQPAKVHFLPGATATVFPPQHTHLRLLAEPGGAWLAIITLRAIRRGSFSSVKELIAKIMPLIANNTKRPAFLSWEATANSILEQFPRRCSQSSGPKH